MNILKTFAVASVLGASLLMTGCDPCHGLDHNTCWGLSSAQPDEHANEFDGVEIASTSAATEIR